ncbi:MAG: MFS transporter [Chloroflexi bacterium]|nr:MFS transporter [Chloroflexota bacterium]
MNARRASWAARGRAFPALWRRDFRLLCANTILLEATRWMDVLVIGWLTLQLTGSPVQVGVAGVFRSIGWLLGPVGGVLADRMDRRRYLVLLQLLNLAQAATLLGLYLSGHLEMWEVYALALANSVAFGMDMPARNSLVGDVVDREDLANAVAINRLGSDFTYVLGPLAAGSFMALFSFARTYELIVAMHAVNVVLLLMMHARSNRGTVRRESPLRNVVSGARVIVRTQVAWLVLLLAVVANLLGRPYLYVMLPVFAVSVLGLGPGGLGLLMGATGIGAVAASLSIAAWGRLRHQSRVMMLGYVAWGITLALFALSRWHSVSLALLVGVGMANAAAATLGTSLLLAAVGPEVRGRVMGARAMVIGAMLPGMMLLGAGAQTIGAPLTLALDGAAFVAIVVAIGLAFPRLWKM